MGACWPPRALQSLSQPCPTSWAQGAASAFWRALSAALYWSLLLVLLFLLRSGGSATLRYRLPGKGWGWNMDGYREGHVSASPP